MKHGPCHKVLLGLVGKMDIIMTAERESPTSILANSKLFERVRENIYSSYRRGMKLCLNRDHSLLDSSANQCQALFMAWVWFSA